MNRGTSMQPMHSSDWEQQQERLSAYLDGELEAAERSTLERHLPTCARCQETLAELRAMRGLLRALPAPALPHSFTLPAEAPVPVPLRQGAGRRQLSPMPNVAARIARQVGGLAAVVGLLLLLGNALVAHNPSRQSAGSANAPASSDKGAAEQHSPSVPSVNAGGGSPSATATPPGGAAVSPTQARTQTNVPDRGPTPTPTAPPPTPVFSSIGPGEKPTNGQESAVPVLPLTGVGLFVGGGVLYIGGRVAGRRARRR